MAKKSKIFAGGRRAKRPRGAKAWLFASAAGALALAGVFPAAAPKSEQPASSGNEVRFARSYSYWLDGVSGKLPEKIELKNGKPDLSAVIRWIKKALESDYDNLSNLEAIKRSLLRDEIKALCAKAANPKTCRRAAGAELRAAIQEVEKEMSGRILYPPYHLPLSEVSSGFVEKAFQKLDSNCGGACHSYPRAFFTDSPASYQKLKEKVQAKGRQCQQALLGAMAGMLDQKKFPKPCLEEKNKSHPVCADMLRNIAIAQERVSDLMELYDPGGAAATEADAACSSCAGPIQAEKTLNPFQELAADLAEKSQCLELNPGEEKTVHSGADIFDSYILRRDPDGGYSIDFPVEFSVDEDYDGEASREEAPEKMRDRVRGCLEEASPMMLGPNGERLKISISRPPKNEGEDSCPKGGQEPKKIAIGSKDYRSYSGKYEAEIDCPTAVHEILHLTGLCDEYKEQSHGFYVDPETGEAAGSTFRENEDLDPSKYDFKLAYDCRVTAKNSIMSGQYERWGNVKSGKNKSLLTAGQFKSILYGSCPAKNRAFNECSRLAYQSSQNPSEKDCLAAKRRCELENGMGQWDKQERIKELEEEIARLEKKQRNQLDYLRSLDSRIPFEWEKRTKGEEHEQALKEHDKTIQLWRKMLAAEPDDAKEIQSHIEHLLNRKNELLRKRRADEKRGWLEKPLYEIDKEKAKISLKEGEARLKELRENLAAAEAWPDP